MITYEKFLAELRELSEPEYAQFQRKIIPEEKLEILGVRTPVMRKLAKRYRGEWQTVRSFPDEYYEVVFIKLQIASRFSYDDFISVADECVSVITDWALCDTFAPSCIAEHRDDFIPFIKRYLAAGDGFYNGGEFVRRFALTTLLSFYMEEEYLPLIFDSIAACNPKDYYVLMGAAWLLAEVIIKFYECGFAYLNSTMCDINVRNKAISKACDSFRLTKEQKLQLKAIRRPAH